MGEIEIGGRRFAWAGVGRGPELLLLNGYAATGKDWDPTFLMRLARSRQVICPDNRGLGDSELGEAPGLTIEAMAADLEALLEALEIESLPVVGWSMGGFVAQQLARRAPERVASLALISTDPGGPEAVQPSAEVWARLIDHSGTPREQASRLISLLFPPKLAAEVDRQAGELVAAARAELSTERRRRRRRRSTPGTPLASPIRQSRRRRWSCTAARTPSSPPPTPVCSPGAGPAPSCCSSTAARTR